MNRKHSVTFDPDIEDNIEKLRQITGLEFDELLNTLLRSPLKQIIADGDTGFLQRCIDPFQYDDKEGAMAVINGYNGFVAELQAAGDTCYHDDAKPARTSDGYWRVLFKSTHPEEQEGAIYR